MRRIWGIGAVLAALVAATVTLSAWWTVLPGEKTVAGQRRSVALYVTMRDGTPIAVDVWRPADMRPHERLPVVLSMTRYWRSEQIGWLQRAAYGLGFVSAPDLSSQTRFLNRRRFVAIRVDARGTGASGGDRRSEWSPEEIADFGAVARWASRQPWSDGSVGAMGVSYSGNTAELLTATGEPAVKAVAPLFDDFDPQFGNANPGGGFNTGFITGWGVANASLDRNDVCALVDIPRALCFAVRWWSGGVRRADADHDGARLWKILAARRSNNVLDALRGVAYRDDRQRGSGGLTLIDISPYGQRRRIEASRVPMLVMAGWMDAATADGAISRYLTFSNAQEVYIGAWSHGGEHDTDPFRPVDASPRLGQAAQEKIVGDFFDRHLRGQPLPGPKRAIHYEVMGSGWRQTARWPPQGSEPLTYFLGAPGTLARLPQLRAQTEPHDIRFNATQETATRWHTQADGADVVYADRRAVDERLQSYTSQPLDRPVEIIGTPVAVIDLASTAPDGLLIVYLEAVAPDGTVRYLTEGVLRLANRAESADATPYVALGVARGFLRADARPMNPGRLERIRIPLYATAVALPRGYRIRLSLAGAADGLFDRLPSRGAVRWRIGTGSADGSRVILPQAPVATR